MSNNLIFVWILNVLVTLLVDTAYSWFESCDHNVPLAANASVYINSPYYPNRYPSGSSCRYVVTAPQDYEIFLQCNIELDKPQNSCGTEFLYVSTEGTKELTGSDYFCGTGNVQRTSLFDKITLAYTSSSYTAAGRFTCLLTTRPQPCDCGWSVQTRIVNGVQTAINEFPFMAGIVFMQENLVFCGGSIISHRHVVSAAHCFGLYNNPSELAVLVGDHDLKTSSETPYTGAVLVDRFIIHEAYDKSNYRNDIAIVVTKADIGWSRGVGPACLPLFYAYATFEGMNVDIAGWGTEFYSGPKSTVLMKATLNVISNSQCQAQEPSVVSSQICTYSPPKDSCQYDSGGPLIYRYNRLYLVGIISFGNACGLDEPSINTRITSYLNWIQSKTPGVNYCRK